MRGTAEGASGKGYLKRRTIIALAGLVAAAGYGFHAWYAARKSASETPRHITAVVKRGDITRSVLASGALQAFKSVKVTKA